nr:hypothetical protein GCM10020093_112930 [Planobispora longispora]
MHELRAGAAPERTARVEVGAPGGWAWDVAVLADGRERASATGLPMLAAMSPFEGVDIGIDRRSPSPGTSTGPTAPSRSPAR